jgi:hypothetical protein
MPAIIFNLGTVLSSAGSGILFALGVTAADYTCAVTVNQVQESLATARHYTYLSLPATEVAWNRATTLDRDWSTNWAKSFTLDPVLDLRWKRATALERSWAAYWKAATPIDVQSTGLTWTRATPTDTFSNALFWNSLKAKDVASAAIAWGRAVAVDAESAAIFWRSPKRAEVVAEVRWAKAVPLDVQAGLVYKEGPALDSDAIVLPWKAARPVIDYLVPVLPPPNEEELPPLELQKGRGYACFHLGERTIQSNFNVYPLNSRLSNDTCFPGAFVVNNTFSAITIADGLPLKLLGFSASTNIGSTAWDYTIGLPTLAELNRIKPTASGPIEIECVLNGYTFRAVIEEYDDVRSHASWGYSASGKGLTVYAASPFAAKASAVLPVAQRSASQLANDAVAALGGFTVNWEAYNFIAQPNMLSYSESDPVSVVSRLATAIGAVVIPHRFNKEFTVKSRYPVSPWDWALPGTVIDQVISKNLLLKHSGKYRPEPTINKVYVAATASGYNAGVKRNGTAGNLLGPQITEPLLTQPAVSPTAAGNLERGRIEIAKSGPRREYNIVTPLVAANVTPGVRLRLPVDLVEVEDDEGLYRAMVGKTSVTMTTDATGKLTVYQNLGLERYV